MAKHLAIVLGVDEYDAQAKLPACRADAAAIRTLLEHAGRFDEILCPAGHQQAAQVKEEITSFFRRYEGHEVAELVFYFSGHGGVVEGEFRFVLRDFSTTKPNSTSLGNSELDDLVRSLKPELYCKVVDACHAGVSYVKDADVLKEMLEKTKGGFKSCYFYFSSHEDQPSLADNHLSHFTRALLEAIAEYPAASLTYHGLAGAAADRFRGHNTQTPYFVEQAKLTEVFLDLDDAMKDRLKTLLPTRPTTVAVIGTAPLVSATRPTLIEVVEKDATRYLDKERVDSFLTKLRDALSKRDIGGEAGRLFECSLEEATEVTLGKKHIAKWLSERAPGEVFAEVDHRSFFTDFLGNELEHHELTELRTRNRGALSAMFGAMYQQREVIEGFHLTETGPWLALVLTATPKYPNLPKWTMQTTYVIGPTAVTVFGAISRYQRSGWESFRRSEKVHWLIESFGTATMREVSIVDRLVERLERHIKAELTGMFETALTPINASTAPSSAVA